MYVCMYVVELVQIRCYSIIDYHKRNIYVYVDYFTMNIINQQNYT